MDDDGLDFGFIELKPFYRTMMEANSVTAITESHWDREEDHEFEEYFVMGLPSNQQNGHPVSPTIARMWM